MGNCERRIEAHKIVKTRKRSQQTNEWNEELANTSACARARVPERDLHESMVFTATIATATGAPSPPNISFYLQKKKKYFFQIAF